MDAFRLRFFLLLSLALCHLQSTESADLEFYDLDDNQVPPGWALETVNDAGIFEGALRANPTDGVAKLQRTVPETFEYLVVEWEGEVVYNYWGGATSLTARVGDDWWRFSHGYSERQTGKNFSRANILSSTEPEIWDDSLVPLHLGRYHYRVELFSRRLVRFSGTQIGDSSPVFEVELNIDDLRVSEIDSLEFQVQANEANPTTADNLRLEYRVPCRVPFGYPSIQSAIDDLDCDWIEIGSGRFFGDAFIERDITVAGQSEGSSSIVGRVVASGDAIINIRDLTIEVLRGQGTRDGLTSLNGSIVNVDTVSIIDTDVLFADGFERGSTAAWFAHTQ